MDFLSIKPKNETQPSSGSCGGSVNTSSSTTEPPVMAEIPITSTQLHAIANGKCITLADGAFGIRFLLKNSFKVKANNFVVKNYVMQVVALGKDNVMQKEEIGVLTKVQVETKIKEVARKKAEKKLVEATESKLADEEVY